MSRLPLAVFTPAGSETYEKLRLSILQDPSSTALGVVSRLPYHINGAALDLRPASGSYPAGTSPKIAFRPSVTGQDYAFIDAVATLTATRAVATATVSWSGAVKMLTGDSLEVRYVYRPGDHMAHAWSASAFLVYYANAADAAAIFDNVVAEAKSTQPVPLSLKLPVRAPEAYPLLFDADTQVKATAGTTTLSRNDGRLTVTVVPPDGGFAAGPITLEFANPKASDGALPRIVGTLTIK